MGWSKDVINVLQVPVARAYFRARNSNLYDSRLNKLGP